MHQGSERTVVYVAMDAVAGARRTPGRHKTGGVPPKPPATLLLSVPSDVLGLRIVVQDASAALVRGFRTTTVCVLKQSSERSLLLNFVMPVQLPLLLQ